MALTTQRFPNSTEDAPRGWVVKVTSTVYRGAMIARYTTAAGADHGFCDNVGASVNMSILGIAEQSGGVQPAGHTLTMSPEVRAIEGILPMLASGLDTTCRGRVAYGVDENTFSLTQGAGIGVGMVMEFIDATHAKIGVGPTFLARAIANQATLDAANVAAASPYKTDELLAPATSATAGLHAATATTVAVQVLLTAALVSGGVAALLAYPRNVTFTTAGVTATQAPDTAVIVGTDRDGNALTESIAGLSGGAATYQGIKAFQTITSITYGAGGGTAATVAVGFGQKFGFALSIKTRATALPHVVDEILDAAYVDPTTATIASAVTSPPHGTWSPATAPNASHNYAITYEHS